jgi:CCR4-NOT transcription complex subunit 2
MTDNLLSERTGSQTAKFSKNQQRTELTQEQIQQQNILKLNGFSSSTILRGASSINGLDESSPNIDDLPIPPGLSNNLNINGNYNQLINDGIDEDSIPPMDKFGLKALSSLLRQEDNDQNNIAKGIDLNMLGLDLSMNRKSKLLSKTLPSPWLETSRSEVEPLFEKPRSFNIDSNELLPIEDRISSFNDLTLFFIFYTKPRDILQELSARELNKRNWRYHKELQVWLTKDTNSEPKPAGIGAEEGTYIFFDPVSWEFVTKTFVLSYNSII